MSKRLAISHGESLEEADVPTALADVLERAASCMPAKGILYMPSDGTEMSQSYKDLLDEALRITSGLSELGLRPQDKVIFQLSHNQDFIPAFWGCVLGGFVPIPVSIPPTYEQPNPTLNKIKNSWDMADHPLVLTRAELAPAVRSLSQLLHMEGLQVEEIERLRTFSPDQSPHASQPNDLAVMLLTSGSTGPPKAVMQTHRNLLSRCAGAVQMNHFTSEDVTLNWFTLDHVVGLMMFHLRSAYVCCQQIHAATEPVLENPLRWLDLIDQHRVTVTWAPDPRRTVPGRGAHALRALPHPRVRGPGQGGRRFSPPILRRGAGHPRSSHPSW